VSWEEVDGKHFIVCIRLERDRGKENKEEEDDVMRSHLRSFLLHRTPREREGMGDEREGNER